MTWLSICMLKKVVCADNDFGPTCLWEPVPKRDNMESAGLAIGIAGLAGLFSACVDVIEKFDAYRDFGIDSRSLSAQFEADKLRFEKWGRAVGFDQGKLLDDHYEGLNDPPTSSTVGSLLSSIREICRSADKALPQPLGGTDTRSSKGGGPFRSPAQPHRNPPSGSKMGRISWALRDKAKYMA